MFKLAGFSLVVTFLVITCVSPSYGQLTMNKDTLNSAPSSPVSGLSLSSAPGWIAFSLQPGTWSWRGPSDTNGEVGTYVDLTSWDSSPYEEGWLKYTPHFGNNKPFLMNFRLLKPVGYDPNYAPGYPMIVMLHGAGERANCWDNSCYFSNERYNPNGFYIEESPPDGPGGETVMPGPTSTTHSFLNNDHNLTHGGLPHLTARNLAGTKKYGDPTLPAKAFPGFVLFPQNLDAWGPGNQAGAGDAIQNAIRIIRLLIEEHNIDPDRIYVHGLSNGGYGTYSALNAADWLFAAAAPMSATQTSPLNFAVDSAVNVPIWAFQGGVDTGPKPYQTEALLRAFRNAGGTARYTLYPTLGHGVWNTAYAEPDFFSWLLKQTKRNIYVHFNNPNICSTSGAGAKMSLTQGFHGYQWERDGTLIPGANSHQYTATVPGIYRARFTRNKIHPNESDWNAWSDPVTISEQAPTTASIKQLGTVHLPAPTSSDQPAVNLASVEKADKYFWYKDGNLYDIPNNDTDDSVSVLSLSNLTANNGVWTLRTSGFDQCQSFPSEPKYVWATSTGVGVIPDPTSPIATITSSSTVLLKWNDVSGSERNYEVWRRQLSPIQTIWKLVTLVGEDVTMFHDSGLEQAVRYEYRIRAVSNTARSGYVTPLKDGQAFQPFVAMPGFELNPPSAPTGLTITIAGFNTLKATWNKSTDDSGIAGYRLYYGVSSSELTLVSTTDTTATVEGLTVNNIYHFTVKAVDYSENYSPYSAQVDGSTYMTGLVYGHSTGAWNDLDPPLPEPPATATTNLGGIPTAIWDNPEFTGTLTTFTIAPTTQFDFFCFQFDGYVTIPSGAANTGSWQFATRSDDGSKLWLDDVLRVNNDGLHGQQTVTSSNITLTQGTTHRIRVRYFERDGTTEGITVSWNPPGGSTPTVTIPESALRSGTYVPPTAPVAPANLNGVNAGLTQNNLTWTYGGPASPAKKIVILGSSTAAEVSPTPANGWVSRLRNWITTTVPGSTVTNLALGGFTTRHVMPDGAASPATPDVTRNITYALSLNPDIIIVNLPTNDVATNVPDAETMSNLDEIYSLAAAENVQMFITTTQPREKLSGSANLFDAQKKLLRTQGQAIMSVYGNHAIDIYDGLTDYSFMNATTSGDIRIRTGYNVSPVDGIHLNEAGHTYIFTQVKQALLPFFTNFELHRATAVGGPYAMISRLNELAYSDVNLVPNTTYHYKVRTVTDDGLSAFAGPVSVGTAADVTAPTPNPSALAAAATSYNNIVLTWTRSLDNVKVVGYRIYINDVLTDTLHTTGMPTQEGYVAQGLTAATPYAFKVSAFDASGNVSGFSNILNTTTTGATIYYSKSAGNLNNTATWGTDPSGSGTAPTGFEVNGNYYMVSNRTTSSLGGAWAINGTLSKVIVPDGVTLTVDNTFAAKVDVQGTGILELSNTNVPEIGVLSPTSTVRYIAPLFIEPKEYGNVELLGTGYKTFPEGTTVVHGNITTGAGVAMRGWADNGSTVEVNGNLNVAGAQGSTPYDFAVNLHFVKNGTQTITTGTDVVLHQISTGATTTLNLVNSGTPLNFTVGSLNGGGLTLANGSTFNIGNNKLFVPDLGGINTGSETGKLAVNGGDITLSGAKTQNSNLYFDVTSNIANRLVLGLTSSGDAVVHSNMSITDGLKITGSGDLSAGGFVTLVSNAAKTANLERIEGTGRVIGDMKVQRYLNPKGVIYRYFSTPVSNTTVATWQQFFPITGNFTGHSPQSTSPSMYYYDETTAPAYKPYPPTSNTQPIERGVGYSVYLRNGASPINMQVTGNPYQGDVPLVVRPDPSGSTTDGWNLVGNPYASTISWANAGWTKTGVHQTISIRNNPTGNFYYWTYTGSGNGFGDPEFLNGNIAPGQAFWVQSISSTSPVPALTVTEAAKVTTQTAIFREASYAPTHFVASVSRSGLTDRTYIILTEPGNVNFDQITDTPKRLNDKFSFSSISADGQKLAMNDIGVDFCQLQVNLSLTNTTAGDYHLTFGNLDEMIDIQSIELVDQFTGTTTLVNNQTDYTFTVTADAATFGDNRFKLRLTRPVLEPINSVAATEVCGDGMISLTITGTQQAAEYMVMKGDNALSEFVKATGNELTISLPGAMLEQGENTFKIKGRYTGCEEFLFTPTASLTYFPSPAVSVTDNFSVCVGQPVSIVASGAPDGGRYNWYQEDGSLSAVSGNTFDIPTVKSVSTLQVAAVNSFGCEGDKKMVTVEPIILEKPVIALVDDTFQLNADPSAQVQWLFDGEPIPGATGSTLKPENSGIYSVTINRSVCQEESAPLEYVTTGLMEEEGSTLKVMVYPNPVKSEDINVRVSGPDHGAVGVSVMDVLQRAHFAGEYTYSETNQGVALPLKDRLLPGMYFIIVQQGGQKVVRKLTVQ